jgi:molecular chaperone GrpE
MKKKDHHKNEKLNQDDKHDYEESLNNIEEDNLSGTEEDEELSGRQASGKKLEISITENEVEKYKQETEDWKDRCYRKAAEFENYKRRTDNDQLNLLKYAAESLIRKLLPVVDDFERSLTHIDSAQDVESIKKGIQLVYEKMMKVFSEQGIEKIDAVGKPFDVNYHEALMQRKDEDVEPNIVLGEVEAGYVYKDKVLRHSKVIVSQE